MLYESLRLSTKVGRQIHLVALIAGETLTVIPWTWPALQQKGRKIKPGMEVTLVILAFGRLRQ